MRELLIVGAGGFIGAVGRYWLSGWVHRFSGAGFPWGTLTVNLAGCLLLGVVMSLGETRLVLSPEAKIFLAIGILGSFTTFSTVSFETIELVRQAQLLPALANAGGSLLLGLVALVAGRALVEGILH